MIKQVLAADAVAASIVGISATLAPQAMAVGDDTGTTSVDGNGSQSFADSETRGDRSSQFGLVQGSLNKPCVGLPAEVDTDSLVGVVPVAVQGVSALSSPQQNQQCTENSTRTKGDEPLSHLLDSIPVLSGNGTGNS
ncbi:rodlin [Streptomyces sp. NPDC005262]|uniref:rodlin n=1 Tax=Streptomyces sp. NPDC005262 TaxID=3364710 RepID=UPI0036D18713